MEDGQCGGGGRVGGGRSREFGRSSERCPQIIMNKSVWIYLSVCDIWKAIYYKTTQHFFASKSSSLANVCFNATSPAIYYETGRVRSRPHTAIYSRPSNVCLDALQLYRL